MCRSRKTPTAISPPAPTRTPEFREALQKGLELCETVQPDLLVATDPDCDRVGIAVRDAGSGEYRLLSGNEVGVLLLDFIAKNRLAQGTMPRDPVTIKTIVSTDLADLVAQEYGVQMIGVLTALSTLGIRLPFWKPRGSKTGIFSALKKATAIWREAMCATRMLSTPVC